MQKIRKVTILYRCDVCKTKHSSKKAAAKCERMPTEKKVFRVGDSVTAPERRYCQIHCRYYTMKGRVVSVIGPNPFDYEYEAKWLGGRGLNTHVFQYKVAYICPLCKEHRTILYFAPELKLLAPKSKNRPRR